MSWRWALTGAYLVVMAVFNLATNHFVLRWLGFYVHVGERRFSKNGVFTLLHVLGSGALGVLLVNALSQGFAAPVSRRRLLTAGALAALYGAILEGLQSFQPSRTVDPYDLLANLVGLSLGLAICAALLRARLRAGAEGALEAGEA